MPRIFGGHSDLGVAMNSAFSATEGSIATEKHEKYGIIKDVVRSKDGNATYKVILEIFKPVNTKDTSILVSQGTIGPFKIDMPIDLLSFLSDPESMINKQWCKIEYKGNNIKNGKVTLSNSPFTTKEQEYDSNNVDIKQKSFAIPGSGMF
jgi:hypothetical protein